MMVVPDLVRAALALSPRVLARTGALHAWQLDTVPIGGSVPATPHRTAALLGRLVIHGLLLLANAWLSGVTKAMSVLGRAPGGLCIARFGAGASIAVDAVALAPCAAVTRAVAASPGRSALRCPPGAVARLPGRGG